MGGLPNQDFLRLIRKELSFFRVIPEILIKKFFSTRNQNKIATAVQGHIKKHTRIYSFSGSRTDDERMWNNYADLHKGIRIDFSYDKVSSITNQDLILERVKYDDNRTVRVVNFDNDSLFQCFSDPLFLMKDKGWLYQNEWRLLRLRNSESPYLNLPAGSISRIILGRNISKLNKEYVKNLINMSGYNISICQEF